MGRNLALPSNDCKKVLSVLCHQEKARLRKRKFLELTNFKPRIRKRRRLVTENQTKYYLRKLRMPRFMLESLIREEDVSFQNLKDYIERNSQVSSENQGHHLVEDYLQLSGLYYSEPAKFFKLFSSALNNLKIDALNHVAQITTGNQIIFENTRASMKKAVEENITEILYQSDSQSSCHHEVVNRLSLILRDPINFRKHLTLITPVTPSLLSSITKIFKELDNVPSICLIAMNRKISGIKVIPEFFTNWNCDKERLIKRLRKQCNKILLKLLEGDELPKPLAKALSVISLYSKQVSRQDDTLTTEFFPFSPEAQKLQLDILKAIWLLPGIGLGKLKILQHLLDPDASILSRKTFRFLLNNYLVEYLYETCEEDVPVSELFLRCVAFINRNSSSELDFCKKNNIEEELETVLNVSSQFKQIILDSFQDYGFDNYMERNDKKYDNGYDSDENDDILVDDNKKCSVHEHAELDEYEDVDLEVVGESEDFIDSHGRPSQAVDTKNINRIYQHTVKTDPVADLNSCQPFSTLSMPSSQGTSCNANSSRGNSSVAIQTICDETSLLAHKLISSLMKKFQERRQLAEEKKETGAVLVEAVEELMPSVSKRYLNSLESFMEPPQL